MKKIIAILSVVLYTVSFSTDVEGYTVSFDETNELSYNSYTGEIKPFVEFYASTTIPYITEVPGYAYGFDGRPKECFEESAPEYCNVKEGDKVTYPIVYISVKEGDIANFIPHNLSTSTHSGGFKLIQEQKYEKKDGKLILKEERPHTVVRTSKNEDPTDGNEFPLNINTVADGGRFLLAGIDSRKRLQDILKIEIIPYDIKPKKFVYIQLDGEKQDKYSDGWDPLTNDPENSFTLDKLTDNFNKLYKKNALVEAEIKTTHKRKDKISGELKDFPIKISDLVEVNMTTPEDNEWGKILKATAASLMIDNGVMESSSASKPYSVDCSSESEFCRIVFAINKERKKWELKECHKKDSDKIELAYCNGFNPEEESPSTKYYMYSPNEDCKDHGGIGLQKTPVTIRAKEITIDGKKETHYYAFNSKTKELANASCDILYTDNGYPIIPTEDAIQFSTLALTTPWSTEDYYDNYLPRASYIFVPRRKGESGQYTLLHELGHSFGFTDVAKTGTKDIGDDEYATTETNVMSWQEPAGKRIRYRDTPIACTGGKRISYSIKGKTGEISFGEFILKGKGENQWDCMRDCYTKEHAENKNRREFWGGKRTYNKPEDFEKFKETNDCILIVAPDDDAKEMSIKNFTKKYTLDIARNYFTIKELKPFYTVETFLMNFKVKDLKSDFKSNELIKVLLDHYTIDAIINDLKSDFKSDELIPILIKDYYYTIDELESYFTADELKPFRSSK